MRMYDIIDNKKHGKELSFDEIKFFVNGFTDARYRTIKLQRCLWPYALRV